MIHQSPEQRRANSQKGRVRRYVHNTVVGTDMGPHNPKSMYSFPPVDDPDYEALYDLAEGEPTMYAIHAAEHALELDIDEMLQDKNASDRLAKIEKARQDLANLHLLELQYTDPLNHPFQGGKPQ